MNFDTEEEDLWQAFHGEDIIGVRIVKDRESNKCKGIGYVCCKDEETCSQLKKKYQGLTLKGREVRVTECQVQNSSQNPKKKEKFQSKSQNSQKERWVSKDGQRVPRNGFRNKINTKKLKMGKGIKKSKGKDSNIFNN